MKHTTSFRRFLIPVLLLVAVSQSLFSEDQIRIASFNLQVFGVAKAEKPTVLADIASIIQQFDIVAVQEIRDGSGTSVGKLLDAVNEGNVQYAMLVGPRFGRSSSKEQYAFFYKTSLVETEGVPTTWSD
jgi:endonuclease/exonuclease/phosphatase family metal-dependent hydrolase